MPAGYQVLDGGMGHLLKSWGVSVPGLPYEQQFLAGVLANLDHPDLVQRAHTVYVDAGARCLTTNNFVATSHNLSKINRQESMKQITQAAAQHARQVADEHKTVRHETVQVLGCLPPLKESYQTDDLPAHDAMVQEYAQVAAALQPSVDVFLAETLSTIAEATAAAAATQHTGLPLWVSWTLEDNLQAQLRSGERLRDAVGQLTSRFRHVQAVLVNCCAPATVTAAMPALKAAAPPGVLCGGYANGFKITTSQWLKQGAEAEVPINEGDYDADGLITPEHYAAHAQQWAAAGAQLIGGCCGVGPLHIKKLATY